VIASPSRSPKAAKRLDLVEGLPIGAGYRGRLNIAVGIEVARALKRLLRQHGFGYAATREAAMAAFAISWRRE
jgi:hypothetical protein